MHVKYRQFRFEYLESRRMLAGVDIPDNLTGEPSEQVLTPVNIDSATGVRGAEILIEYDTTVLDATVAGVLAGSVWAGNAEVVASVDDATGTIDVFVFAAEALGNVSGSLVEIQFVVRASATPGSSTVIDLADVQLNEGAISLDVDPQPGADSTDGRISISDEPDEGDASISGFVFGDTNSNNLRESLEGLPGVTVVLINVANNQQTEVTTQDNGAFSFSNLAPGSYRLQERQPAAYLDGGPNEITIQLAADQTLANQNFRERGLRPEFVFNRLFTTLVMPIGSTNWIAANRQIIVTAGNVATGSTSSLTQSTSDEADESPSSGAEGESSLANFAANGTETQEPIAAKMVVEDPSIAEVTQPNDAVGQTVATESSVANIGIMLPSGDVVTTSFAPPAAEGEADADEVFSTTSLTTLVVVDSPTFPEMYAANMLVAAVASLPCPTGFTAPSLALADGLLDESSADDMEASEESEIEIEEISLVEHVDEIWSIPVDESVNPWEDEDDEIWSFVGSDCELSSGELP